MKPKAQSQGKLDISKVRFLLTKNVLNCNYGLRHLKFIKGHL